MEELERLLNDLEVAFQTNQAYFDRSERLGLGLYWNRVDPILARIVVVTNRLIELQYLLNDSAGGQTTAELIHYTSIAALISILGGVGLLNDEESQSRSLSEFGGPVSEKGPGSIRLYDSDHFNDPDEGEYLVRTLGLFDRYPWIARRPSTHAYIASFIRADDDANHRDNLVYWQTYGFNGNGCSIAMPVPNRGVRNVLYGRDGMRHTETVLTMVLDRIDHIIKSYNLSKEIQVRFSAPVWEVLDPIVFLHKSDAYDYERECRYLVPWSEQIKDEVNFDYRETGHITQRVRHFIERDDLQASGLLRSGSRITLGPMVQHPGSVKLLLETMMARSNLNAEVRLSEITFRGSRQ